MHLKYVKNCRVCGNQLAEVLNLGFQHLQGSFVKGNIQPPTRKIPLLLGFCDPNLNQEACGLLQLMHSVPPEILYKKYWYRSGTNKTMSEHLRWVANNVIKLNPTSILDIGCNDGTFLQHFPDNISLTGIDPSDATKLIPKRIRVINGCFPGDIDPDRRFDVISSFAMLYDLEDPIEFLRQVKHSLAHNGVFIFEVAYLPTMIQNCAFDNICHEHLEYYSLATIEFMLKKVNMKVFSAKLTDTNCGSIICMASNDNADFEVDSEALYKIREDEFSMALDSKVTYGNFALKASRKIEQIKFNVKMLTKAGKTIHIYGSSTKGNVIIQAAELHRYIKFAADRNPEKHGAETLGTGIKIISEEESRAMKPDFYLVLPWHFRDEFLEREKLMRDQGVKFIFPLPNWEVV